jgi:hypothetical protein
VLGRLALQPGWRERDSHQINSQLPGCARGSAGTRRRSPACSSATSA